MRITEQQKQEFRNVPLASIWIPYGYMRDLMDYETFQFFEKDTSIDYRLIFLEKPTALQVQSAQYGYCPPSINDSEDFKRFHVSTIIEVKLPWNHYEVIRNSCWGAVLKEEEKEEKKDKEEKRIKDIERILELKDKQLELIEDQLEEEDIQAPEKFELIDDMNSPVTKYWFQEHGDPEREDSMYDGYYVGYNCPEGGDWICYPISEKEYSVAYFAALKSNKLKA